MPNSTFQGGDTPSSRAMPSTDTLRSDASAAVDEAKDVAAKVANEAKTQGAQIVEQAKSQLSDVTDKARDMAEDQKTMVAGQVGGVADAMSRVADELEASNGPSAHYARMIADNAEQLSSTIRDKSVDELLGIAQDFGRKQPAAFIGAAALLGFVASRFVMASANRPVTQPAPQAPGSTAPMGDGFVENRTTGAE
ncbi:MAG TPA: hypothetical protein VG966_12740 [Hyphomicrobiaceae bacterium]|nr:hypothetical protein [Hyphomicrobiaceae bacterium]